jgi:hypothetical protein
VEKSEGTTMVYSNVNWGDIWITIFNADADGQQPAGNVGEALG